MRGFLLRFWTLGVVASVLAARLGGAELEPVGRGPFAIGCTNLEVTPREGVPMFDFLNGKRNSQGTVYLTDILTHPDTVPTFDLDVPADATLYGAQASTTIPVVVVVFYPTTPDNPRPDYAFPYKDTGDKIFPHMQRRGERPLLPDTAAKYPLILFSGGYNTHPLWHFEHLKLLASRGYIVADVVHGDGRGATLAGNTALRVQELHAALDYLLRRSEFASAIDVDRIGAAGQSAGGHTILAAMGGVDPSGRIPPSPEPRIKAGFGLVPFMGGSFGGWPFKLDAWYFGEDFRGLRSVRAPFLAVYGEKDKNVLAANVEAGVRMMSGPVTAIMLDGEVHGLTKGAENDALTWEALFFDAWLRGDASAQQKLATGTSVRGGVNDHRTYYVVK